MPLRVHPLITVYDQGTKLWLFPTLVRRGVGWCVEKIKNNLCLRYSYTSVEFPKHICFFIFGVVVGRRKKRRRLFCSIMQHLTENHKVWKKVIDEEDKSKELAKQQQPDSLPTSPSDDIQVIQEEEEGEERQ